MKVGQVYYTPWCDEHGKVIDDGTVHRVGEEELRWTAADPQYRWLTQNAAGLDVADRGRDGVAGGARAPGPVQPRRPGGGDGRELRGPRLLPPPREPDRRRADRRQPHRLHGRPGLRAVDPGRCRPDAWDALFAAGKAYAIRPAGMHALDVVRLEAGMVMLEVDYTSARHAMNPEQNYSPFEIGLGKLVSFEKGDYVGRRALPGRGRRGWSRPAPRRPPARLVRHRGPVRRPGPAAGHQPLRRPLAGPGLRRRAPGGQGDLPRLEPDPQAGARPGVRAGPLRAAWAPSSRWSGRSRAAAAASPPPSWSCRSSTSRASAHDRRRPAPRRRPRPRRTAATDFAAFDRLVDERIAGWVEELVEFLRIPSEGGDAAAPARGRGLDGRALRRAGADVESWSWTVSRRWSSGEMGEGPRTLHQRRPLRRPAGGAARPVDRPRRTNP